MPALGTVRSHTYGARHKRQHRRCGSASARHCEWCLCPNQAAHWALIHDRDGDEPADYMALCGRCHMAYDEVGIKNGIGTRRPYSYAKSEETRAKIRAAKLGTRHTEEQKAKISATLKAKSAVMSAAGRKGALARWGESNRSRQSR